MTKAGHTAGEQASEQGLKYIKYFIFFFSCCLLSWEITELSACLFIMRPEYIGNIFRHQLINHRIKGEELVKCNP